jgi:hypothetical protein
VITWAGSCAHLFHLLDHNWIPYDEGLLAQSAERVLLGQMPHRDFAEVYTGGLSYVNALGFQIFGLRLLSLRYLLFAGFMAWVPAVFYCASRFVSPLGAVVVTGLAVVWTVPNYPAAMPSWYNLFFATFGVAALLRFIADGRRGWLFAAGVMGGCSILAKISGLYFIAAGFLFLIFHEAVTLSKPGPTGGGAYGLLVGTGLLVFLGALVLLLHQNLSISHGYHFLLPAATLGALVQCAVSDSARLPLRLRLARLWRVAWPFLVGVGLPVGLFLAACAAGGGLATLARGVLVSPIARLGSAAFPPATALAILPAGFMGLTILLGVRADGPRREWIAVSLFAVMPVAALLIGGAEYAYHVTWVSVSQGLPLIVVSGALVLLRRLGQVRDDVRRDQECFLLLAAAGLCSLIEFPLSHPTYFTYTAPLSLLALLAVLSLIGRMPRRLALALAGYYGAFAMLVLNTRSVNELGLTAAPAQPLVPLELHRGGLLVGVRDASQYRALVDTLAAHAQGSYTYAGPDAPEVYFLSGLRNPTRTLFEFLEPTEQATNRVLAAIDRHGVTAVAINRDMKFSPPLSPELEEAFAKRFPHATTVGKFTVRWQ